MPGRRSLGRSLLGQRTTDIAAITQSLAREYPKATVVLAARDKMTVPSLCAAALESRISKVYLAAIGLDGVASSSRSRIRNRLQTSLTRRATICRRSGHVLYRGRIVAGADGAGRRVSRTECPYADYRDEPLWDFATLSQL